MSIDEFLKLERHQRRSTKWLIGTFNVMNDHGVLVRVTLKSFELYNQMLYIQGDPVNYCSGHTLSRVGAMHKHLRDVLNHKKPELSHVE